MLPPLLLLLCLSGQMMAKTPPDVECFVMNMEYVQCSWNKNGIPEVNYTFSSWFKHETETNCSEYLLESGTKIGCNSAFKEKILRFHNFYTTLTHGSEVYTQNHKPAMKVKLNPPVNLTVKYESDSNLWFYWNQTDGPVQSQVYYRKNNNNWEHSNVGVERTYYCIKNPSNSSRYELQVRSRYKPDPEEDSEPWSDWSGAVVWSSVNSPNTTTSGESMSAWTPVLYVVGVIVLLLLILLLMKHERLRIIFISVVPKPSLKTPAIKDWFQFPQGLRKEDFKVSYTDQACSVCEYTYVSPSDSSRCNTTDLTGDTDDCSVTIAENESEEPSSPADSSYVLPEEEQQVMV